MARTSLKVQYTIQNSKPESGFKNQNPKSLLLSFIGIIDF